MDTFGLKIISSDRVFYEGRCRKMIVPGTGRRWNGNSSAP